jgi:hypothetical protein
MSGYCHKYLSKDNNTATALTPLTTRCRCCLRAGCFRRAAAVLLASAALPAIAAPLCPHCHCAHTTNTALQMPSPCCLLLPHCCCAASADAAITLPTPPPRCQRRHRAANTAAVLPPLPPLCCRLRAASATLPTPPPCCRHLRRTATTVAAMPPPLPCCHRRHSSASASAAALPPRCLPPPSCRRRIQCRRCAAFRRPCTANAATSLPTLAAPLPRCLCRSANAATAHPTLPPHFCHRLPAAAVANALPPLLLLPCNPASPLLTNAELPPPPSPPPLHCQHPPCAADASTMLLATAAPLPRCLRRSANAATALPLLTPCCRFRASAALLPCCFC